MSKFYRGPSIDASYQVSYHLAKRFQRKSCFRNRPIRKKNYLWRPCLLTDQNGMSIFHRGPSIDASYNVSFHCPLKPLGESIYGRSSIKSAHFVPIHLQTCPPQEILVSDWLISKNLLFWNRLAKWSETW
jgi:hypothetical protein